MTEQKKKYNPIVIGLFALVIFVVLGTAFVMTINGKEARIQRAKIEQQKKEEQAKKEAEKKAKEAEKAAFEARKKSDSLQPGVAVGTFDPNPEEKVVYLTFDDGPSPNTETILDILKEHNAKATFFITGSEPDSRPFIKRAYEEGHTIGLHTYSHDYASVYSSEKAYFEDLKKVGEVAKEQIGFVPCYIRFPGGSSNVISAKYSSGIMTKLVSAVQEKGYQYYDWNVDSGDGAGHKKDQIISSSETDQFSHAMILMHDSRYKTDTVAALPSIIEYYKNLGYEFKGISRDSFVSQHSTNN